VFKDNESIKLGLITLFASSSTLICCALPALFVILGAGATFASIVNFFPQLIIISQYKVIISIVTGIILLLAGYLIKKASLLPCPTDPNLRNLCLKTRKRSKVIYFASIGIFVFASFFTYVLPIYL
tara:strand:- start:1770 stop:2147 length:378 start_codon:yes stop_codon:yes gene_type:complete